jgi:ABC-type glutathione transport system ATPase component
VALDEDIFVARPAPEWKWRTIGRPSSHPRHGSMRTKCVPASSREPKTRLGMRHGMPCRPGLDHSCDKQIQPSHRLSVRALGRCALAKIVLSCVVTDFPIYDTQSSLRRTLLGRVAGGALLRVSNINSAAKRVVVRALDNVSLTIQHGDQLGILGHNGAGKSTMLRVLAGIYEPTRGSITIEGRVSPLFTTSPGLLLDDTGYENIVTCGLLLGMTREEIERKLPEIEAFTN